jgi:hypothetical protein
MSNIIFRATSTGGFLFKVLCDLYQASFSSFIFTITEDGISSRMTNAIGTMLFDLTLRAGDFDEFYLAKERIFCGVSILHLHKVISSIKKKDSIRLEIFKDDPEHLVITMTPKEKEYIDMGSVVLEKVQNIETDLPEGYDGQVEGCSSKFNKMWKELSSVSKTVSIRGNSESIVFSTVLEGIIRRETAYGSGKMESSFSEQYRLDDFLKLNKIASFGSSISFSFKEGLPFRLITNIGSLGSLSIYVRNSE